MNAANPAATPLRLLLDHRPARKRGGRQGDTLAVRGQAPYPFGMWGLLPRRGISRLLNASFKDQLSSRFLPFADGVTRGIDGFLHLLLCVPLLATPLLSAANSLQGKFISVRRFEENHSVEGGQSAERCVFQGSRLLIHTRRRHKSITGYRRLGTVVGPF